MTNQRTIRDALRVTKALGDLQRLRILLLLGAGELCVCQVVAVLDLAPSTVSKHLALLQAAGLIESRKEGRWAYYRMAAGEGGRGAKPVLAWLDRALAGDETRSRDARTLQRVLATDPAILCRRMRKGSARA